MTVIMAASNNPVTSLARGLYEESGRPAILFTSEQELEQLIELRPELLHAIALFPVATIPNDRYVCSGGRLERLGKEALIPDWSKRFTEKLALLDMPLDQINGPFPALQSAVRSGLHLPNPPLERTEEEKRRRAARRTQHRNGRTRSAMGHFCG